MSTLNIHDDALADLEALRRSDLHAAVRILALLEQLAVDEDLLDRLTQHGYGKYGTEFFDVSKWHEQQRKNNNLWRLKFHELELRGNPLYRVIYSFDPLTKSHHVLAIAHRDFNYEANHVITARIHRALSGIS